MKQYLVLDIGGTGIKWARANEAGMLLQTGTAPAHGDNLEHFLDEIEGVYRPLLAHGPLHGVAISSPGFVNRKSGSTGGASALPCIHTAPLAGAISRRLDGLPAAMENDGNCGALGEYWKGAGQGYSSLAMVVCGSGIGCGFVYNGGILSTPNHASAEFGFMPMVDTGGDVRGWSAYSVVNTVNEFNRRYGMQLTPPQLFDSAVPGSREQEYVDRFYHYLAVGVLCISFSIDPGTILFGGAISKRADFLGNVNRALAALKKKDCFGCSATPIGMSTLGNDANLYGALYNLLHIGYCNID